MLPKLKNELTWVLSLMFSKDVPRYLLFTTNKVIKQKSKSKQILHEY